VSTKRKTKEAPFKVSGVKLNGVPVGGPADVYRCTIDINPETTYREKAANLYQAMCRLKRLAKMLNDLECPGYSSNRDYCDTIDALSYSIREIADKTMLENEA
jgi:hypothetical protein